MATADPSDEENLSDTGSGVSYVSDSEENSDVETDCQLQGKEPCKYYNGRGCKDGGRCPYLHVCKYALTGSCRYGSKCKLNHPRAGRERSREGSRDRSTSSDPTLTDGRHYQWQLNNGDGWLDVDNDHILEAQYSLPHTKGIKIYNTSYGAVSIDFNRMRVIGKRLRVRRLDDGQTVWVWFCILRRKWIKYGDKDSKGNTSPVKSSDIEKKFQSNPASSFTFAVGADTIEIKFREMRQVTAKKKRKVTRRPLYRHQPAREGNCGAAEAFQNLSLGDTPKWQFEGDSGAWHDFRHRQNGTATECSVGSEEIERKYRQNPEAGMTFKVKGRAYKLDFKDMIQINLKNKNTRRIRRCLI